VSLLEFVAALYGTQEQVDVNWKIVTEAFGKSGKAKFLTQEDVGDDPQFGYRAVLMTVVPSRLR
jgi:4-cresol dehydrogenase (hydroxylating)